MTVPYFVMIAFCFNHMMKFSNTVYCQTNCQMWTDKVVALLDETVALTLKYFFKSKRIFFCTIR